MVFIVTGHLSGANTWKAAQIKHLVHHRHIKMASDLDLFQAEDLNLFWHVRHTGINVISHYFHANVQYVYVQIVLPSQQYVCISCA